MKNIFLIFCFTHILSNATTYNNTDIFTVSINDNDKLLIRGEVGEIDQLAPKLYKFITTNQYKDDYDDNSEVRYARFSNHRCNEEIKRIGKEFELMDSLNSNFTELNSQLNKWKTRLKVLNIIEKQEYRFIHETFYIAIKVKSKTSYQMYIEVLSTIKSTIDRVRDEKAKTLFNLSYRDILVKKNNAQMRTYLQVLKYLVPDRIVDLPVIN